MHARGNVLIIKTPMLRKAEISPLAILKIDSGTMCAAKKPEPLSFGEKSFATSHRRMLCLTVPKERNSLDHG